MFKILIKILNICKIIKVKKINCIFFIDSFGGLAHFYLLLSKFKKNKKILILCNNNLLKKHIKKKTIVGNKLYIEDYNFNNFSLKNYLFFLPLVLFKIFNLKIDYFYTYKLISDPIKIILINIFWSKQSKIITSDQFINFYNIKKRLPLYKDLFVKIINLFLKIKIHLYLHKDFYEHLYPCLNIRFHKKIENRSIISNYKSYYKKIPKIKKNSIIYIDGCIGHYKDQKYIDYEKTKIAINRKINLLIKLKKIKNLYIKIHPGRKNKFLKDLKIECNVIFYRDNIPAEVILDKFDSIILSISSSIFYLQNKKIYSVFHGIFFINKFKKTHLIY